MEKHCMLTAAASSISRTHARTHARTHTQALRQRSCNNREENFSSSIQKVQVALLVPPRVLTPPPPFPVLASPPSLPSSSPLSKSPPSSLALAASDSPILRNGNHLSSACIKGPKKSAGLRGLLVYVCVLLMFVCSLDDCVDLMCVHHTLLVFV